MLENIFKQLPIFNDLSLAQLDLLKPLFTLMIYEEGEVVFEQDASADYLYIVVEGDVAICFKPDDGEIITVARIKRGGVFGWSAAFGNDTYTSGAACASKSKLLRVLGDDLKNLRKNHPETGILILERLAAVVAKRIQSSNTHNQVVALLEHALKNGVKPIGG